MENSSYENEGDYSWVAGNDTTIRHFRQIGAGGCGDVHEMIDTKRFKNFARKVVRRIGGRIEVADMIRNEVRVLKKICAQQHRNIVTFLDREGTLPQWGHYFDMELCDCNLHDYIQKQLSHLHHLQESRYFIKPDYDLDDVLHIMKDITCGLAFVHSHAEVHRDLKPRNVLYSLELDAWKLTDFGITAQGTSKGLYQTQNANGTPSYRAPELLSEFSSFYNNKSDVWALGCILYELVTSKQPFSGDFAVVEHKVSTTQLFLPKEQVIGTLLQDEAIQQGTVEQMIQSMCNIPPDARPSASDVEIRISELISARQDTNNKISSYPDNDVETWKRLVIAHPKVFEHQAQLGEALSKGDIDDAIKCWADLVDRHPQEWKLQNELRKAYSTKDDGRLRQAVNGDDVDEEILCWKALVNKYPSVPTLRERLQAKYINRRSLEHAIRRWGLVGHGGNKLHYHLRTWMRYRRSENQEIRDWEWLVDNHPDALELQKSLDDAYTRKGNVDHAVRGWATLVDKHPTQSGLRSRLSDAYLKKGDEAAEITGWRYLVDQHPSERDLHGCLATAYQRGKVEDEIEGWTELHQRHPQEPGFDIRQLMALLRRDADKVGPELSSKLMDNLQKSLR